MAVILVFLSLLLAVVTGNQANKDKANNTCIKAYKNLNPEVMSRYIDASGKPGSGIYGGNDKWLGSFSECSKLPKSRYCLAGFVAVMDMTYNQKTILQDLQWGVCVPDTCTKDYVLNNLDYFLNSVSKLPLTRLKKDNSSTTLECAEDPDYSTGVVLTIIFCAVLATLCLIATIVELSQDFFKTKANTNHLVSVETDGCENVPLLGTKDQYEVLDKNSLEKVPWNKILHCFSLIRNTNSILNTDAGKSDLVYLHGIRVLSLFWVILVHFSMAPLLDMMLVDNKHDVDNEIMYRLSAFPLSNQGTFAVDSFFVLSALLAAYVNLMKLDKNQGVMNWFYFYFHRFWRLTPSLAVVILLHVYIRPLFDDGPRGFLLRDTSACSDYWWTNFLYINNFHPKHIAESCITPTWYLATDMQFYILSPIFIITFFRFGFRSFLALASVTTLASFITTGILIGRDDDITLFALLRNRTLVVPNHYTDDVGTKPYCRISTYMVGLLLGCVFFTNKERKFQLKLYWVLVFWFVAIGTALALVYAPHNAVKHDPHIWTTGERVVYVTLSRFLWGLCVVWVIFACQYGYAGLIKSILSEKFWIPLSRINYAAYILHMDIITVVMLNIQTPIHFTTFTLIIYFLSFLVLTYACAFIFTTMVELPFANLEALYWKRGQQAVSK